MKESQLIYGIRPVVEALRSGKEIEKIFLQSTLQGSLLQELKEEIAKKNAAQEDLFRKLSKSGEKNIYFLNSSKEIGRDNEATVDGVHFTDLGMVRYTDFILPTLKKALKKSK